MQMDDKIIFVSGCIKTVCYANKLFLKNGDRRVSVLHMNSKNTN